MRDHGAPARRPRHHRTTSVNTGKPAGPGVRPICVNRTDDAPPGCLTIPLLIVVVPVRLAWEVLSAAGRLLRAYVVRPIGWLLWWAARYLLAYPLWWVLRTFVLLPARWIFDRVLVSLTRAIMGYVLRPLWAGLVWLAAVVAIPLAYLARRLRRALLVLVEGIVWLVSAIAVPVTWILRRIGRGLAVLWRVLVQMMLWPVLRAVGRLVVHTWRLAGVVLFHLLVRPVRFLWRVLVTPVLRAVAWAWRVTVVRAARWTRVHVWEPARASARSISRALGLATRRP